MTTKILLDTDLGSDIDDAVCLAYLLAQKDCDLLGITTVTGEPVKRAMIGSALCKVAGVDIPIFPGYADPLQVPQRQKEAPQAAALDKWEHDSVFAENRAVPFLAETILAHPGEVTLLAIGPLTNVAVLFRDYPAVIPALGALVMMCGEFTGVIDTGGKGEWNAQVDPHATEIVYQARTRVHRSIGLDVTMQTTLPAEEVRASFNSTLLKPVRDFAEVWFRHAQRLVFHDPLAAATIFDDQICTFARGDLKSDAEKAPGIIRFEESTQGWGEVALQVDPDRYFQHFFATLNSF